MFSSVFILRHGKQQSQANGHALLGQDVGDSAHGQERSQGTDNCEEGKSWQGQKNPAIHLFQVFLYLECDFPN